jgi:DNA-directed RNA polymerase specialized sigma24 family protein
MPLTASLPRPPVYSYRQFTHTASLVSESLPSIKQMASSLCLKEWGRMARTGLGLGYPANPLNHRRSGDALISVDDYDSLTKAIRALPPRHSSVIVCVYHLDNSISMTAIKLGTSRYIADKLHTDAVAQLYLQSRTIT